MSRFQTCLAVLTTVMTGHAIARGATLIAASDDSQIEELSVAKVMARDSSFWLAARLRGAARLALVTEDAAVDSAPAADAWLRALDFTTRLRVAAPPGPLWGCGSTQELGLVDTGLPEPPVIRAKSVEVVSSELELRRALQDAGLRTDAEPVARFTSSAAAPFRISLYDVPRAGGATAALRVLDSDNRSAAPHIEVVGRDTVPLSLIALASAAVLPTEAATADPSEFAVLYRAASSASPSSDYVAARASWLQEHSLRWLIETQNSASLFAWTALTPKALLAPATTRYFEGLPSACAARVRGAFVQGSQQALDYTCGDHDDLALSLSQLGFADLRLSRLYGSLGPEGLTLRVVQAPTGLPLLNATDLDRSACPASVDVPTTGGGMSSSDPQPPTVISGPGGYYEPEPGRPVYTDDGGCNVTLVDSESCNGDSSSSDPSGSDSCSGDSSTDSSDDSCSGDSSTDSSDDSCSGDSSPDSSDDSCSGNSDPSSDSDGCSKNDGYDGDTCTGSSRSSAEATGSSSAALRANEAPRRRRPRRAHLSFLTLLAAALVLPFRRWRAHRF